MFVHFALCAAASSESWSDYAKSFAPWQPKATHSSNFLENARMSHHLPVASSVKEFHLPESTFTADSKDDDISEENNWSLYDYVPSMPWQSETEKAVEESEEPGYVSSVFDYVTNTFSSENEIDKVEESPVKETNFKKKVGTKYVVIIVCIAVVILGAAGVLVYGKLKRRSDGHPVYAKV